MSLRLHRINEAQGSSSLVAEELTGKASRMAPTCRYDERTTEPLFEAIRFGTAVVDDVLCPYTDYA